MVRFNARTARPTTHRARLALEQFEQLIVPAAMAYSVTTTADAGTGSLRQAIADANANPGPAPDTITLDYAGTITLASDLPTITDSVAIVRLNPAATGPAYVDGGGSYRAFTASSATGTITVSIAGVDVQHGDSTAGMGGAVYNDGEVVALTGVNLANNAGTSGGAIYQSSGTLTVNDSTITGNGVEATGGGIYVASGAATVRHSLVTENGHSTASPFTGSTLGGGIYAGTGSVTVTDSTVSNNGSTDSGQPNGTKYGGGIYLASGTLAVTRSEVSANGAYGDGGGVYVAGGVASMTYSTLDHNIAGVREDEIKFPGFGGGIFIGAGSLSLVNGTVAANTASQGGGLYVAGGVTATLSNSTVVRNEVPKHVYLDVEPEEPEEDFIYTHISGIDVSPDASLTLYSTLVGDNRPDAASSPGGLTVDVGWHVGPTIPTVTANYSLIEQSPTTGKYALTGANNVHADPALDLVLVADGGTTRTVQVAPGSPAVDAGGNALGLTYDQRWTGYARTVGEGTDIGAQEYDATAALDPISNASDDSIAPTASVAAANVTTRKGTLYTFTVTLSDDRAVDVFSIQGSDFLITGPGGSFAPDLVSVSAASAATPVTVTLSFVPPGGAWDALDNGDYDVSINGSVSDTGPYPNFAAGGEIGSFTVAAPVAVAAVYAALPDGTFTSLTAATTQRSVIPELRIVFDGPATGADIAASYQLMFKASSTATLTSVSFTTTATTTFGVTTATLTPTSNTGTQGPGLDDGYYTLTLSGTAIGTGNVTTSFVGLDGDDNGTPGGDYVLSFTRYLGDADNDAFEDGADFGVFAAAFNTGVGDPGYLAYMDLDGDGYIDGADFGIFASRFNSGLV